MKPGATTTCEMHGEQPVTHVCVHVADAVAHGRKVGFWWYADDEVGHEAHCDACEKASIEMSDAEWDAHIAKVTRDLCLVCYQRAATMNDVSLEEPPSILAVPGSDPAG